MFDFSKNSVSLMASVFGIHGKIETSTAENQKQRPFLGKKDARESPLKFIAFIPYLCTKMLDSHFLTKSSCCVVQYRLRNFANNLNVSPCIINQYFMKAFGTIYIVHTSTEVFYRWFHLKCGSVFTVYATKESIVEKISCRESISFK